MIFYKSFVTNICVSMISGDEENSFRTLFTDVSHFSVKILNYFSNIIWVCTFKMKFMIWIFPISVNEVFFVLMTMLADGVKPVTHLRMRFIAKRENRVCFTNFCLVYLFNNIFVRNVFFWNIIICGLFIWILKCIEKAGYSFIFLFKINIPSKPAVFNRRFTAKEGCSAGSSCRWKNRWIIWKKMTAKKIFIGKMFFKDVHSQTIQQNYNNMFVIMRKNFIHRSKSVMFRFYTKM